MSHASRSAMSIVTDHYAAGARGDLTGMLADLHPEVRWVEADGFQCAGTHIGPSQVVQNVFAVIDQTWRGFGFHPERFVQDGDSVVALGSYRGTHRVTGVTIDVRTAHVWTVRDGRIVAFEQFTDTLRVAQAMR